MPCNVLCDWVPEAILVGALISDENAFYAPFVQFLAPLFGHMGIRPTTYNS